ncbi:MAG: alpha-amylase family glycosyl hydrolase [Planctomycetota bacterium]
MTFRVWAPDMREVRVAGDFNGWQSIEPKLVHEGNGYWSLDYRNAEVGDEYKYVLWDGTNTHWRVDPYTQQLTNSVGNAVVYDATSYNWQSNGFNMPGWNELVIYQMHIGTFNDSPGGSPGNFNSAINRLDHVKDLGANIIQLLPVTEFAGDFSWGYNPAQPFAVESAYGGADELKRFIDEAHQRGIGVMTDVVHNHWGPSDLALWRFTGWGVGPWGGLYFYNDERAATPWGDTRPDFGRSEVRQYIRDNVLSWIEEFRMDGMRWDSTSNIRTYYGGDLPDGWSLMQWINNEIDGRMGWKLSIAEDMQNNEWMTKSTGAGGAGFDSQWDPNFVHPVREALIVPDDSSRNMWAVRDAINFYYNGQMAQRVIYTESHDEVANGRARVPEEIWPGNADSWYSKKRSTLGGVLVMTSPGIPMIFQGQEILEDGWFDDRDPVDWSKKQTHRGIFQLYKDVIQLRRNWFNNTRGLRGNNVNVFHVNDNDKVIAYHRWDQGGRGDDVIVVMNFSNQTFYNYNFGLPRDGVWRVRFNSDWNGYSADFGNFFTPDVTARSGRKDNLPYNGNIDIAPYTAVILSQD